MRNRIPWPLVDVPEYSFREGVLLSHTGMSVEGLLVSVSNTLDVGMQGSMSATLCCYVLYRKCSSYKMSGDECKGKSFSSSRIKQMSMTNALISNP